MNNKIPLIAIVTPNVLTGLGLRSILEGMFPFAAFRVCDDFSDISGVAPEDFFHLFVTANFVVEQSEYFEQRRHKTIVLTVGTPHAQLLAGYPQINISGSQSQIEDSLKRLHGSAHHGAHTARERSVEPTKEILSPREIEVLKLLVDGLLNKEIASRLNISLTTVITHRKNIVEKLGVKSLAGLTIYAVMKRYIEL